jgi:hypothetical protein
MKKTLLLLLFFTIAVIADEPSEEPQAQDFASVKEENVTLELKLIPQSIIDGQDLAAGALTAVKKGADILAAKVGDLAFLVGIVRINGKPADKVEFEITFHHIEDGKDVFTSKVVSKNGQLNWGQQFFDGAMHKVTLKAKSPDDKFPALMAELNVDVEGIDPPSGVVIKSISFLLGIVLLGMIIGYLISVKVITNKATV